MTAYLSAYDPAVTEVAAAFTDYVGQMFTQVYADVPTLQAFLLWYVLPLHPSA